jgi:hypothetical protein
MTHLNKGRFTAEIYGDFVVFLIGMRINRPLRFCSWVPVAAAMPKMLRVLDAHPEYGCLGHQRWMGRTSLLVQYWKDFDSLHRFATAKDLPHLEPWRRFTRSVGDSGTVGIWHETYLVRSGEYEAVYANMPDFGLAAASAVAPVRQRGDSAAARLRRSPS